jgi:DNA-binding NtrC family response regulator
VGSTTPVKVNVRILAATNRTCRGSRSKMATSAPKTILPTLSSFTKKATLNLPWGKAGGAKMRAAELMELSLSTLYRKIEKLGIEGLTEAPSRQRHRPVRGPLGKACAD